MSVGLTERRLAISELNFEATVRGWLDTTKEGPVPTGLSVEMAMLRANDLLTALRRFGVDGVSCCISIGDVDVLHALARILETGSFTLETISSAYDLVATVEWANDEFCERDQLLAKLAYVAWSSCRRRGDYHSMRCWQDRCVNSVTAQEIVRNFLALSPSDRSPELNRRFLSDPTVVLALASKLALGRNRRPAAAAQEAGFAYDWLTKVETRLDDGRTYLAAEFALSAGAATRHLGRLRESMTWALRADKCYSQTEGGSYFRPQVSFLQLCIAYAKHESGEVLLRIADVVADLERTGPPEQLWRCRLLEAMALKDTGRLDEALLRLEQLMPGLEELDDPLLLSLTLAGIGEIAAKGGNYARAISCLKDALAHIQAADTPWAIANLHAELGEVLRDQGRLAQAIESYSAAVTTYAELGMDVNAAYLRIVLAETLIAARRHGDAMREILTALPIIEREQIAPDAAAAISLLRKSLREQATDPFALRRLREHLDQMREGGGS